MFFKFNKKTNRLVIEMFGFRFKLNRTHKLRNLNEILYNLPYELADSRTLAEVKLPKVISIYKTLDILTNSDKSMTRFGDGEFKIIVGESINFQKYDEQLADRLIEILANKDENILVCVPDVFGYCSSDYFRRVMVSCRKYLYKYINFTRIYGNSMITRQYDFISHDEGQRYYKNIKNLWDNKDIIIVEGEGARCGIGNDLFANAKKIERILCPIKDAFSYYNEIIMYCKKQSKEKIFIIALGPTATVLAYDLAKAGYRALDSGHIDMMYEWFLRNRKCSVEGKIFYNNERHQRLIKHCIDNKYYEQIIAKVGVK